MSQNPCKNGETFDKSLAQEQAAPIKIKTTFSFQDLLVGNPINLPKPAVKIIVPPAVVTVRKPKVVSAQSTAFQASLPKAIELTDENGEKWNLRCFCDNKSEQGVMVFCEKCQCW